jgi:hypothetical protein
MAVIYNSMSLLLCGEPYGTYLVETMTILYPFLLPCTCICIGEVQKPTA